MDVDDNKTITFACFKDFLAGRGHECHDSVIDSLFRMLVLLSKNIWKELPCGVGAWCVEREPFSV